jgi:hypothetical protein
MIDCDPSAFNLREESHVASALEYCVCVVSVISLYQLCAREQKLMMNAHSRILRKERLVD